MFVHLLEETSWEIHKKLSSITPYYPLLKEYFSNKNYGADLTTLYITYICESATFANVSRLRKPSYKAKGRRYTYQGVEVERPEKSLGYDVISDYNAIKNVEDIRPIIARDILNSLNTIITIKKITDFDLPRFKSDFEQFFKENGWLD